MNTVEIEQTEAWSAFIEMRKAKGRRAPFTDYAKTRILFDLRRFKADGHDVEEILWTSVTNGWSGVFAPKRVGWRPPSTQAAPSLAVQQTNEWLAEHTGPAQPVDNSVISKLKELRRKLVSL